MDCFPLNTKPRWARRKEVRSQELLAAALDLFVERGYAATRLDDVAARAGVSKGTLYLYFSNKKDLFNAVVRENMLLAIGEAEQTISHYGGSSTELLHEILLGLWERIGNNKLSGITKLIMAESGNFPEIAKFYHDEVISRGNAMIIRVVDLGIACGEFRAIDAHQVSNAITAQGLMLMIWKHSLGASHIAPIASQEYLNCVIDLLLHGLRNKSGHKATPGTKQ